MRENLGNLVILMGSDDALIQEFGSSLEGMTSALQRIEDGLVEEAPASSDRFRPDADRTYALAEDFGVLAMGVKYVSAGLDRIVKRESHLSQVVSERSRTAMILAVILAAVLSTMLSVAFSINMTRPFKGMIALMETIQAKGISRRFQAIRSLIEGMEASSKEALGRFEQILERTRAWHAKEAIVKAGIDEQSAANLQLLAELEAINATTQGVRSGSRRISDGADAIRDRMGSLSGAAREVSGLTARMVESLAGIERAVDRLEHSREESQACLVGIEDELGRFKTSADLR